ncbi:MAG: hypothetical protein H6862_00590 [Rhodospirillales bacterium]|nr:hypothetical protein [Rhodospirillales bacterium]
MDEIEKRLRDTADECIRSYEVWSKNRHDGETRENMQEAIHALRKVASRLEVELAISEREELAQRPIPIPPHRAARGRVQQAPQQDDDTGNRAPPVASSGSPAPGGVTVSRIQRRRRPDTESAPQE